MAIRKKVGIKPGDKAEVAATPEGVIVRKVMSDHSDEDAFDRIIDDIQQRCRGQNHLTPDDIMTMVRDY